MNLLLINGSPRTGGNTEILLRQAIKGAEEEGISCDRLDLGKLDIRPCKADFACVQPGGTGQCIHQDDMRLVAEKVRNCDGFIFGSPVYLWSMTSQMQLFLHRTTPLLAEKPAAIKGKPAGLIVVSARRGNQNIANVFNMYFITAQMPTTDAVYGYAHEKGGIKADIHSMKSAFELGRCISLMIKEKKHLELPAEFHHNFMPTHVCRKYGLPLSPGGELKNQG